jgi:hypothetical protein
MPFMRRSARGALSRHAATIALVAVMAVAFAATASSALASPQVNIVTQGAAPAGKAPSNTHYFKTIQSAVNASKHGDWVLVEPGVYDEEVKVEAPQSGIWIRGMNRNTVILDGQHKVPGPQGANGIEIYKANNVYVENLTVRNFDRASSDGQGGNEIWWNGGANSNKIGANGWFGRYLTAYDDGLNGGYGIFTNNETHGWWEKIYASGFNDSGMYLGACGECRARISEATMEDSALGYSGSNSGGKLVIEHSIFRHNTDGIAPNSENPGDGPPPQNGACKHPNGPKHLPHFTTTEIERCTIFRENLVTENDNLNAPDNHSSAAAPWGVGIELPGVYGDLVEKNTITNNPHNGVLAFEYPNPYPPQENTIYFQVAGNRISDNTFSGNGYLGGSYAGDVVLAGGLFGSGKSQSTMNCLSGNSFADAVYPAKIEETWGCQNVTTPNPNLGFGAVEYLLELQAESEARTPEAQPAPAAQETMPNACEDVPKNPLCP